MMDPAYRAQVALLLRILPHVAAEDCFALKGGTAINLFWHQMPRLSVDIDVTYLPLDDRTTALANIHEALARIRKRLENAIDGITVRSVGQTESNDVKLVCQLGRSNVKIEANTVMRGQLWPTRQLDITQAVQDEFETFATATVISHGELFGGKLCAALDRQHPRDLFDVRLLLQGGDLTEDVRLGFIASLLSHGRPMHEVLRPTFQDQRALFNAQFDGMTLLPFTYDDFEATGREIVNQIHAALTDDDRAFLMSFKQGDPEWSLFPHDGLKRLPAVQWKLSNIRKLRRNARKHAEQLRALGDALSK